MRRFHDVGLAVMMGTLAGPAGLVGCGDPADEADEADACRPTAAPSCAPLYPPTFDELYARRLAPGCAASSVCHAGEGRGGLGFDDADSAWAALRAADRVVPGSPECGTLMARLTAEDPAERMPPGGALSAAELCVVRTWIAGGAAR